MPKPPHKLPPDAACDCGSKVHLLHYGDRYWCPVCLANELRRLQALAQALELIVAKLPRCWRLDTTREPKLVQDAILLSEMTAWWLSPSTLEIVEREIVGMAINRETGLEYWCFKFVDGGMGFAVQCYDTREAAEFAKAQGASDAGKSK